MRKRERIVQCQVVHQRSIVGASPPFDRMQLIGVWSTVCVEPRLVVVSNGVDDEGIALPVTYRMAPPSRDRVIWVRMLSAVHKDLSYRATATLLTNDVDCAQPFRRHRLHEVPREWVARRDRDGSAEEIRLVLLFSALLQRLCPWQQRQLARL